MQQNQYEAAYNTPFAHYIAVKTTQYGDKFDASDLNPNCVSHYNAGELRRVKVRFRDGEERWGRVGVTTGWKPCFLLMHNRRAVGSGNLIGEGCLIVDYKDMKR